MKQLKLNILNNIIIKYQNGIKQLKQNIEYDPYSILLSNHIHNGICDALKQSCKEEYNLQDYNIIYHELINQLSNYNNTPFDIYWFINPTQLLPYSNIIIHRSLQPRLDLLIKFKEYYETTSN